MDHNLLALLPLANAEIKIKPMILVRYGDFILSLTDGETVMEKSL
jgi:hypothetical protein